MLVLENYKVLGQGELKDKLVIKAAEFSVSAKEKIEKVGGKWLVDEKAEKVEKAEEAEKIDNSKSSEEVKEDDGKK